MTLARPSSHTQRRGSSLSISQQTKSAKLLYLFGQNVTEEVTLLFSSTVYKYSSNVQSSHVLDF